MSNSLSTLPAIGAALDGGIFAGIITQPDGTHCAVILLPQKAERLTWKKSLNWAKKQNGVLPTRPVAAMIFANVKASLSPGWHWTSEQDDASYAWICNFNTGLQFISRKSFERGAVAVRMIPLTT